MRVRDCPVILALVLGALVGLACTAPLPGPTEPAPTPTASRSPEPTPEVTSSASPIVSEAPSAPLSPSASPSPSVAPSPSATPHPSSSPSGELGTFLEVVRDDLSDPRSGFPTVDDETQRVAYEEGALRLDLKLAGRATWTTRFFGDWPLADVEGSFATIEGTGSGFYGLTCGVDPDDYYAGVVASDGTALLLRVDDGVATRLAQQLSAVTPPLAGISQAFRLECIGGDSGGTTGVSLSVAGREIISAADPGGFAGLRRAGFYAESSTDSEGFSVRADDFVVTVGLRAGPDSGPSATPSLTGDPEADALAEHVPEAFRATCRKVDQVGFDEAVAIDCPSVDVATATYLQYTTLEAMEADYQALVDDHPEADGPDCAVGPGEGPYTVDGAEVGQLLCFELYGAAVFAWTDTRIDVMGYARRADGSFDALYDWWLLAGPVP